MGDVLISISVTLLTVSLFSVLVRLKKQEKTIEELKKAVFRHEVILEQDQDPLKNWPDKDLA